MPDTQEPAEKRVMYVKNEEIEMKNPPLRVALTGGDALQRRSLAAHVRREKPEFHIVDLLDMAAQKMDIAGMASYAVYDQTQKENPAHGDSILLNGCLLDIVEKIEAEGQGDMLQGIMDDIILPQIRTYHLILCLHHRRERGGILHDFLTRHDITHYHLEGGLDGITDEALRIISGAQALHNPENLREVYNYVL